MRTVIRHANVFDGTGEPSWPATVIVDGERIQAVLPAGDQFETLDGDKEIDGRGCTLMPGLIDAHTHLSWGSSVEKIYHQFILPPDELKVATWRNDPLPWHPSGGR